MDDISKLSSDEFKSFIFDAIKNTELTGLLTGLRSGETFLPLLAEET